MLSQQPHREESGRIDITKTAMGRLVSEVPDLVALVEVDRAIVRSETVNATAFQFEFLGVTSTVPGTPCSVSTFDLAPLGHPVRRTYTKPDCFVIGRIGDDGKVCVDINWAIPLRSSGINVQLIGNIQNAIARATNE